MNRSESRSKSSQKRDKTRASQASTTLALSSALSQPQSDQPAADVPGKITMAKQGLSRAEQAFATTDMDLILALLLQTKLATGFNPLGSEGHHYIVAAVHSLGARDGVEALLATQMVAVHNLAMNCLANASVKEQTERGLELYANRANSLLRTFTAQMEALKKYRSRGEQHCTVEHVHVHSGGQAVVGTINQSHAGTRGATGTGGGGNGNAEQ